MHFQVLYLESPNHDRGGVDSQYLGLSVLIRDNSELLSSRALDIPSHTEKSKIRMSVRMQIFG